jgi:diacylglycerol kinase family enzyme
VLFVNPRSGGDAAARSGVVERAREQGIEFVILSPGQNLAALAEAAVASGADALGMAGGDGSLAFVAAAAAAHDLPFVCIPAGTRNHFALDIGVDRNDVAVALDAFNQGVERRIDMAEVNGRLFLNNVSLGIYGDAVQRAAYRDAKVRTLLETAQQVLSSGARAPALVLTDDAGREHRQPVVVLVSNNPYALDQPLARGTRPALDSGKLGISSARRTGRSAASTGASLDRGISGVGRAGNGTRWDRREAADLSGPLRFVLRPASLRVRISRRHPGASPSARLVAARRAPMSAPSGPGGGHNSPRPG